MRGGRLRKILTMSALWLGLAGFSAPAIAFAAPAAKPAKVSKPAARKPAAPVAPSPAVDLSTPLAEMAGWVAASGDNRDLPFVIIDKVSAQVAVFGADGRFKGAAPALLGSAFGDDSSPGVGDRELSDIAPEDRTTPAGRFFAGYGPAAGGKTVLWVDYGAAISLHEVVTAHPKERRPQRLRSATPEDNRITYGCINVAPAFYRNVVRKTFSGGNAIVYVLPEDRAMAEVFPQVRLAGMF